MNKKKVARRALLASVISLILCCAMLVGTTMAWFTDSVSSVNNKIVAGNLDIELEYLTKDGWKSVDENTNVFETDTLWEPGHTEVVYLKVSNVGSLSLKYKLGVNIAGETGSVNKAGDPFKLSEYIQMAAIEDVTEAYPDREAARKAVTESKAIEEAYVKEGVLYASEETAPVDGKTEQYVALVVFMPENVDNAANYKTLADVPEIKLGIALEAIQKDYEEDSFGDDYDDLYIPEQAAIKAGFQYDDGTGTSKDITKKITKVVFGTPADYPDVVANNTPVSGSVDTMAVYQLDNGDSTYTVYYLSESKILAPANCRSLFKGMSAMTEFDGSNLDMSGVTDAFCMFIDCANLEKVNTADWDTSNITNMQSLFYGCNKLSDIDVSNWDTSNVTNMRMVFFRCYALSNDVLKGVENWDVSNVSNFYSMFKHARGLTSLDLSKWDTSSATNMSHLFANIGGLEKLDLSGFDTSKVTDMSWMFYDNSKLTTVLVGDGWTTAAVDPTTPTCFYNNQSLVGGKDTTWLDVCDMKNPARPWESSAKIEYAIVDGGTAAPGLLTHK